VNLALRRVVKAVGEVFAQTPEKLYIYKGYPLSSSGTPDAVFLSSNNI
jgi:hypothetical protein